MNMDTVLRCCYIASCCSYSVFGILLAALPDMFVPVYPHGWQLLPLCLAQSVLSFAANVFFFPACLYHQYSTARRSVLMHRAHTIYMGGMLAVLNWGTLDPARYEAIVFSSIFALGCFLASGQAFRLCYPRIYMLLHTVWHALPIVAVAILVK